MVALRAPAPSGGQTLPPSDTSAQEQESHEGGIVASVGKPSIAAWGVWGGVVLGLYKSGSINADNPSAAQFRDAVQLLRGLAGA